MAPRIPQDVDTRWHALSIEEVLRQLACSTEGLSRTEAFSRLQRYGPNYVPRKRPPSLPELFVHQFRNPVIYILAVAAFASLALGDLTDCLFISAVLLLNALIGTYEEWRAERNTRSLERLLRLQATVSRDREIRQINAEELVVGDIVWLESGKRVPADLRLISTQGLEIDESALTGESIAVVKDAAWMGSAADHARLGDRLNLAFAGTTVVRGRGKGVVIATGLSTALGEVAADILTTDAGKPPLVLRLERFTATLGLVVLAAVVFIGVVGVWRGYGVGEMFFIGVALAVSAIPEGLPVVVTVALAIATNRMAKRGVIVRHLPAVEGLGSCTLIATDKTGTLTCNELTVRAISYDGEMLSVSGEGFVPNGELRRKDGRIVSEDDPSLTRLLRAMTLCNEAELYEHDGRWVWHGDPTDIALLSAARKAGKERMYYLQRFPLVGVIPFEPERRYSASFHRFGSGIGVVVKGAPERVFTMCAATTAQVELDRHRVTAEAMAEAGLRVLAFAEGDVVGDFSPEEIREESMNPKLLGLVGMIDPLRGGVKEAVQHCYDAGIRVVMVTGDHPVTALAIARELRLADSPEQVMTGEELERLGTTESLSRIIGKRTVFARVSPGDKLRIVQAAQAAGHFVAVTGDGVNDASALRAANVGVAMGKGGTDVARDVSHIVISDDNFTTIVNGVEEGRVAYENIRKVVFLLISTGAAEVLMVLLAVGFALPLPLLPVQFLWLNLVTNGIQDIALAFEPKEAGVLQRRPRSPGEPIFNRLMIERTVVSAIVMGGVSFAVFAWLLARETGVDSARNIVLLLMVLFQNVHVGNARSEIQSAFLLPPWRNPHLLLGVLGALGIHVASIYSPLGNRVLRTEPVPLESWSMLILLALTVFLVSELHKLSCRMRRM